MLKTHLKEQVTEEQGSHSTEENLLTIRDLSNIFVDNEALDQSEASVEVMWPGLTNEEEAENSVETVA